MSVSFEKKQDEEPAFLPESEHTHTHTQREEWRRRGQN
jgi:hypothetical protein